MTWDGLINHKKLFTLINRNIINCVNSCDPRNTISCSFDQSNNIVVCGQQSCFSMMDIFIPTDEVLFLWIIFLVAYQKTQKVNKSALYALLDGWRESSAYKELFVYILLWASAFDNSSGDHATTITWPACCVGIWYARVIRLSSPVSSEDRK